MTRRQNLFSANKIEPTMRVFRVSWPIRERLVATGYTELSCHNWVKLQAWSHSLYFSQIAAVSCHVFTFFLCAPGVPPRLYFNFNPWCFQSTAQYYLQTMKCLLFFLVASLSSISADDVVDLGDSDFDSKLADMETALVMFYAPW